MRVSIEGLIKRCTSILDAISESESLEGYSQEAGEDKFKVEINENKNNE